MDGIGLLEKAREKRPQLKVILMTAYATVQTAVLAMKKGACDYLTKPFEASELILRIQSLLGLAAPAPAAPGQAVTLGCRSSANTRRSSRWSSSRGRWPGATPRS